MYFGWIYRGLEPGRFVPRRATRADRRHREAMAARRVSREAANPSGSPSQNSSAPKGAFVFWLDVSRPRTWKVRTEARNARRQTASRSDGRPQGEPRSGESILVSQPKFKRPERGVCILAGYIEASNLEGSYRFEALYVRDRRRGRRLLLARIILFSVTVMLAEAYPKLQFIPFGEYLYDVLATRVEVSDCSAPRW